MDVQSTESNALDSKEQESDDTPPIRRFLMDLGVGPAITKRMENRGYTSLSDLALEGPSTLAVELALQEETVERYIRAARNALDIGFKPADTIHRPSIIGFNCSTLDSLLGGIETGSITEFYGGSRAGKTQVCHQIAVNVQLPVDEGGLEARTIFIDTMNTFRPERLVEMGDNYGLSSSEVTRDVIWARAHNPWELEQWVEHAIHIATKERVKLIVVDSIINLHSAEWVPGPYGNSRELQQHLNMVLHHLQQGAAMNDLAIVITNQIRTSGPSGRTSPQGGHSLAHISNMRCYLARQKGRHRSCRLVASAVRSEGEALFAITEQGIVDLSCDEGY